ncbi:MAG: HDOD domain-containing protein, partial [Candidatus Hydrogenedentes bacterium]|nr:HDOD domain-containing protein [Candidatus Hydrogenedentota bacterium]
MKSPHEERKQGLSAGAKGHGGERMPAPPRTPPQGHSNEMAKRRIGELLVEAGLVQVGQLQEGLALQSVRGGKIVETLILLGHLNADAFLSFLARQPGVASIDLSKYFIPREVRGLIPRDMAIKHEIVPIDRLGHLLTVAMACPLDSAVVRDIALRTGLQVKPLLCAASDIRAAVDRYYATDDVDLPDAQVVEPGVGGLDASFKLSNVARMIRQIDSLPVLPETVRRVQEATLNPLTSVRNVSDIIVLDPPIAAKVLSVANSAAYGFPHRIDDVTLAVSLLGLYETYSIVLSVAVINVFDKSKTFDYRAFWLSSICCAAATRIVAKASGRSSMT